MTQDLPTDEAGGTPEAETGTGDPVDVAYVMPAAAYEGLVTEVGPVPAVVATTDTEAAPPGVPEGDRAAVEAVHAVGEALERRFDEMKAFFERETRAEASREKVIDRLHAELQEYKQDLLLSTLRPVFIDLIQLHDDIGKVAVDPSDAADGRPAEARRLAEIMEGFMQGIEDILYRQGVEPFHTEGDTFDPRRQRAVATVPTDDPALNRTVAARHRKGFHSGDRVIRPEIVSVFAVKK